MKKSSWKFKLNSGLLAIILSAVGITIHADNFQGAITCNGVKLSISMPESAIEQYCKVTTISNDDQIISGQSATKVKSDDLLEDKDPTIVNLSKILFNSDDGSKHICYYRNNKLVKCK